MKNDKGETVPAIIVLTKRGQIFAFDRRDGTPITRIEEKPVPTEGSIPENTVSPTQPYSVGLPAIAVGELTEAQSRAMAQAYQKAKK